MVEAQSNERRVAITGLGLVSALGTDLAGNLASMSRGERAQVQYCCGTPVAAVAASFDPTPYFRVPKSLKLADRKTRFAVAAATMAQADAGIYGRQLDDAAVILGVGGSDMLLDQLSRALAPDPERRSASDVPFFADRVMTGLTPLWLLITLPNMASAHVAIQLGAGGPNNTIMTDCIAGAQAIGEAYDLIRGNGADLAVCGGSDSAVSFLSLEGCRQAGLFDSGGTAGDEEPSEVTSFIPSEGAGILVLEDMPTAVHRGARIYAEIVSYSCRAGGAHNGTANLMLTIEDALRRAGWSEGDVHVTCRAVIPARSGWPAEQAATRPAMPSVRTVLDYSQAAGFAFAASGAIGLVLLLGSLEANETRANIMLNSVGISGQAAALCLRTFPDAEI